MSSLQCQISSVVVWFLQLRNGMGHSTVHVRTSTAAQGGPIGSTHCSKAEAVGLFGTFVADDEIVCGTK